VRSTVDECPTPHSPYHSKSPEMGSPMIPGTSESRVLVWDARLRDTGSQNLCRDMFTNRCRVMRNHCPTNKLMSCVNNVHERSERASESLSNAYSTVDAKQTSIVMKTLVAG
jgi:hypothetical protein